MGARIPLIISLDAIAIGTQICFAHLLLAHGVYSRKEAQSDVYTIELRMLNQLMKTLEENYWFAMTAWSPWSILDGVFSMPMWKPLPRS